MTPARSATCTTHSLASRASCTSLSAPPPSTGTSSGTSQRRHDDVCVEATVTHDDTPRRKLIEVALPLEAINREAAREKSIRHGHPSTLHLWWARRPLAACRAVLFASLIDDPSSHPEEFPTEADQDRERQRLFRLLEELVKSE